jgi:hypothetical protein
VASFPPGRPAGLGEGKKCAGNPLRIVSICFTLNIIVRRCRVAEFHGKSWEKRDFGGVLALKAGMWVF